MKSYSLERTFFPFSIIFLFCLLLSLSSGGACKKKMKSLGNPPEPVLPELRGKKSERKSGPRKEMEVRSAYFTHLKYLKNDIHKRVYEIVFQAQRSIHGLPERKEGYMRLGEFRLRFTETYNPKAKPLEDSIEELHAIIMTVYALKGQTESKIKSKIATLKKPDAPGQEAINNKKEELSTKKEELRTKEEALKKLEAELIEPRAELKKLTEKDEKFFWLPCVKWFNKKGETKLSKSIEELTRSIDELTTSIAESTRSIDELMKTIAELKKKAELEKDTEPLLYEMKRLEIFLFLEELNKLKEIVKIISVNEVLESTELSLKKLRASVKKVYDTLNQHYKPIDPDFGASLRELDGDVEDIEALINKSTREQSKHIGVKPNSGFWNNRGPITVNLLTEYRNFVFLLDTEVIDTLRNKSTYTTSPYHDFDDEFNKARYLDKYFKDEIGKKFNKLGSPRDLQPDQIWRISLETILKNFYKHDPTHKDYVLEMEKLADAFPKSGKIDALVANLKVRKKIKVVLLESYSTLVDPFSEKIIRPFFIEYYKSNRLDWHKYLLQERWNYPSLDYFMYYLHLCKLEKEKVKNTGKGKLSVNNVLDETSTNEGVKLMHDLLRNFLNDAANKMRLERNYEDKFVVKKEEYGLIGFPSTFPNELKSFNQNLITNYLVMLYPDTAPDLPGSYTPIPKPDIYPDEPEPDISPELPEEFTSTPEPNIYPDEPEAEATNYSVREKINGILKEKHKVLVDFLQMFFPHSTVIKKVKNKAWIAQRNNSLTLDYLLYYLYLCELEIHTESIPAYNMLDKTREADLTDRLYLWQDFLKAAANAMGPEDQYVVPKDELKDYPKDFPEELKRFNKKVIEKYKQKLDETQPDVPQGNT